MLAAAVSARARPRAGRPLQRRKLEQASRHHGDRPRVVGRHRDRGHAGRAWSRAAAASARITRFDPTGFDAQIAGEVKGFDPLQFVEKKDVKKMDVFIQFAIAASQFAMDDTGLKVGPDNATRVGVFIASGIGGFATIEREHTKLIEGGPGKISPFFIPASIINLAAGHVSIRFGAKGPNLGHLHRVLGLGARARRRLRDHPARRRRRDDRRRVRGGDHADGRRRLRRDARPVHPQRRARAGEPAVRRRARRVRHRRGLGRAGARGTRLRARARRPHLRRDRRLRRLGRRVPHHRARARTATAPCGRCRPRCGGLDPVGGRLHQRPRHVDAAQRQDRDAGDQAVLRRPRAPAWPSRPPSR